MACSHKFKEYLDLSRVDFEPSTLIIGTFNPEWPYNNTAKWFYGRTKNNYFWEVLPRIFQKKSLKEKSEMKWKHFCKENAIAITDLITSIDDADSDNENHCDILGKFTDSGIEKTFKKITFTDVVAILKRYPSIKYVYLTTMSNSSLLLNLWNPIEEYCNCNQLKCVRLVTPSKNARFFMTKNSNVSMPDFIYNDWQSKWHF